MAEKIGLANTWGSDSYFYWKWEGVAILYFNNDKKAALDIMELLKVDPGYYMPKSVRPVSIRRKHSSIYRMSEPQRKTSEVLRHYKRKQQDKNLETEGTLYKKGSF